MPMSLASMSSQPSRQLRHERLLRTFPLLAAWDETVPGLREELNRLKPHESGEPPSREVLASLHRAVYLAAPGREPWPVASPCLSLCAAQSPPFESLIATHHSSRITHHTSLITHHAIHTSLITHHTSLITHHTSLVTRHSLAAAPLSAHRSSRPAA